MSPESLQSYGELTIKDDIWAYGMLILVRSSNCFLVFGFSFLQELFTTKPPFYEIPGLKAVISRILQGAPSRPTDKDTCGRLTDAWWDICSSCWHREPSGRPSISEILRKLQQA